MKKIKYSKDTDALLIELSDTPIKYAGDEGQVIIHFSVDDEPVLIEVFDAKQFIVNLLTSVMEEKEIAFQ